MKYIYIISLMFLAPSANAQVDNSQTLKQDSFETTKTLSSEMSRLKIETAFVLKSQSIEGGPLWSPNSDFIACLIQGKWYKFRLTGIDLNEGKWHEQTIGVVITHHLHTEMTQEELEQFTKVSKFNPREVITNDGTKIELKETGEFFSTSLIVTKKGEGPKTLWSTGGENCHSLSLSPDGQFVAYVCEMNGLLVMKLK